MQVVDDKHLNSAGDLVSFLDCEHLTTLYLRDLETSLPKAQDDAQAKLIQGKGFAHEAAYLRVLQEAGAEVVDVKGEHLTMEVAVDATLDAMLRGAVVIYQACFRWSDSVGYVDFLRKVDSPSSLGDHSYEVVDTKLARSPKARFVIQLCLYSDLLCEAQDVFPRSIHVVLGDGTEQSFSLANYFCYYRSLKARFLKRVSAGGGHTYPEPCAHCDLCHWRDLCEAQWEEDDHLCLVANITKTQIEKLNAASVTTLAELAGRGTGESVPGMHTDTYTRLRGQAAMQLFKRETGMDRYDLLKTQEYRVLTQFQHENETVACLT